MRFFLCAVIVSVVAACGSAEDVPGDASTPTDATVDAIKDTGKDNSAPGDTGTDTGSDSGDLDAEVDADIDTGIDAGVDSGGSDAGGCTSNADCIGTYYCEKGDGNCSGTGTCTLRPTICTSIYNPVCGCDKTTHANPCESHAAGSTVFYKGLCE